MNTARLEIIKQKIKEQVVLSDLIIRLTGADIKKGYMLCPFHNEKTASMNINDSKGVFYCFGCGVGGDIFDFIRYYQNLNFIDSLKFIDELYCLRLFNQKISAKMLFNGRRAQIQQNKKIEEENKKIEEFNRLEDSLIQEIRLNELFMKKLKSLSDDWYYCLEQLATAEIKLDVLLEEWRQKS